MLPLRGPTDCAPRNTRAPRASSTTSEMIVMVLLVQLSSCAARGRKQTGPWDSKMPDFSWEKIPVAYHGANYDRFSDASIALLAKYPVITLEKCQGWRTMEPQCRGFSCLTCCEEDVYATVGRQVKALNPRTKVVAYLHSNKVMPWYRIRQTMHNYTDLEYCYNGDTMNETTCTPANTNEVFYDFRKSASLKLWSDACIAMTKTGYVDGCFADGALKVEAPVAKDIRSDFLAKKQSMLKVILYNDQKVCKERFSHIACRCPNAEALDLGGQAVQEAVPGPIISGSGGGYNPVVAASQVQSFSTKHAGWWGDMMHMNASASQGHMFEAHGGPLCVGNVSSAEFEQEYAAFLMFAQKWTYHICGSWCGTDPVWPKAFDMPLGPPKSDAVMTDDGIWTRTFESGTQIFFNQTSAFGWVKWGTSAQKFIDENF